MIKFKVFEQMKEKAAAYQIQCQEQDKQRAAAKKELADAQEKAKALLDRQIKGESVIDELARAKAEVSVAEEKYKRLVAKIGENNAPLDLGRFVTVSDLQREISQATRGAELKEHMKEELDALNEAKQQYLLAAEKALEKFYSVQKYVREVEKEAVAITQEGLARHTEFYLSSLRPALWVEPYDHHNDFNKLHTEVREKATGPTWVSKGINLEEIVLPAPPKCPTEWEYTDENGGKVQRQSVGVELNGKRLTHAPRPRD
jgi:hypothetical protein